MLTGGVKVLAGGAIAGIAAYYIVTRSRAKAARAAEVPSAQPASRATDGFELLGQLVGLDEFYELIRHCSAIDAVRLSRCSSALHELAPLVESTLVARHLPCLFDTTPHSEEA